MIDLRAFLRDEHGGSAAEFVLVLPVLALLIFGLVDVGMFAWRLNLLQKATQAGVRYATVTDIVASNLATANYVQRVVGGVTLMQGDVIPAAAMDPISCTGTGTTTASAVTCSCATSTQAPCPTPGNDLTAFNRILSRVRAMDPTVSASNLQVDYRGSGLGYAGDPGGLQISPIVTVRLRNMQYHPLSGYIFKAAFNLPDFASSMTMEDGSGTWSN